MVLGASHMYGPPGLCAEGYPVLTRPGVFQASLYPRFKIYHRLGSAVSGFAGVNIVIILEFLRKGTLRNVNFVLRHLYTLFTNFNPPLPDNITLQLN